ncbi:phosphoenolpyruvate--protein phosphotransferase [Proteiniphilum sp. UBA5384]|uniref:phosphoenolpyruvate--protein phosphotransferase n=1 Tax=Proteiniphilum sp. UBA5384 TaxID=1947279 RepID=UPI0025DA4A9E|nr:phosphoenolpyruvate--protein phosphotransferase [Proteiniphilum sp. UBA5384]
MKKITGTPASPGKVAGKTFRVKYPPAWDNTESRPDVISKDVEIKRFSDARSFVRNRLTLHLDESSIFAAHIAILEDISEQVISKIKQGPMDAVSAVEESGREICFLFADMEDEYLSSRSDDIVDISRQLVQALTQDNRNPFSSMPYNSILIADNLLVSDTLLIDRSKLAGIALRKGSKTSHIAILARDNEIPLVLGLGEGTDSIPDNKTIIIDGGKGEIIIEFEEELLSEIMRQGSKKKEDMNPAITKDGVEIKVYGNAGNLDDVKKAISKGADGIGLLRTEFIFMEGSVFPDEDTQYATYLECARTCQGKNITIRTLDIGADKQLPYHTFAKEENPLLGLRGIRFSLAYPKIFKVQLRAILRASVLGNIRIMFPMVTSIDEYNSASALLEECKIELKDKGVGFDNRLHAGIMVETPASVMLADDFARTVAFFSIGTNDLTQYMLAVDRNNPYSMNVCDYFNSAVVKGISEVATSSRRYAIDVSVCGEMASDPYATELLLKLGIRKLSVASSQVPSLKEQIRKQSIN